MVRKENPKPKVNTLLRDTAANCRILLNNVFKQFASGNPLIGFRTTHPTNQKVVKQMVASHLYSYCIVITPG